MRHFCLLFLAALVSPALFATTPPALQISSETAPAGGWAQLKIYAVKPMAIASGHILLNLDSTAFGPGTTVGLFGANGDAEGRATLSGSQMDVLFSSPSGGIGQLAGLPVLVFSVPVLASAGGRTVAVTASSPDGSVSVASGSVTLQGSLSVQNIPAGMGVLAEGSVVPVYGTGFTAATTVTIDGAAIASTQFVSAQEIDLTLAGETELAGKRARVIDSGVEFDYFCFQPNPLINFPSTIGRSGYLIDLANAQPLFPLFASTGYQAYSEEVGGAIDIQNPNAAAASVTVTTAPACCGPPIAGTPTTLSIPAGSWAVFDGGDDMIITVQSSLPVRVVSLEVCTLSASPQICLGTANPYDVAALGPPAPILSPTSLAFAWQTGTPAPAAQTFLAIPYVLYPFAATTATTTSGGSWLSVSSGTETPPGYTFSVSVNPAQLAPGTYGGSILLNPGYSPPSTLPVTLTVAAAAVPMISAAPTALSFSAPAFNAAPDSQSIALSSNGAPAAFSVAVPPGSWLKVSPLSGTTPATLTVTWDPTVTSQIYYQQRSTSGSFVIAGPGNQVTVAATFNVTGVQTFQTYLGTSGMGPDGLVFSAQTGSSSQTQTINVDPAGTLSTTVNQPWMTATAPTTATIVVTANPAGLAPGVYSGAVTIAEPGIASIAVPVVLAVWSTPPPLTISTPNFTFVQTVGEAGPPFQTAEVDSGGVPVPFTIAIGGSWLSVVDHYSAPTPVQIQVGAGLSPPEVPGQYDGSFTLQSPGGSVYVPVTLLVEPGPLAPPVLSQVVNAASGIAGAVSPGEIVSLRGYGVGAPAVAGLTLNSSGLVASYVNGFEVTFNGTPAPLVYTSANQTNLVVPYEVANGAFTTMQTLQIPGWVLPVAPSAPGIFTVDATGAGQAAAVNQDGSVNSAANPAARGSVVSIYATGEGQTSPAGITGSVTKSTTITPVLPVAVTIGGIPAAIEYAGSAPGEIAGVLQVNAVVPQGTAPGPSVPVVLTVGGATSQPGVTIAVN